MVFLAACTGVWADTGTILIKEGSGRISVSYTHLTLTTIA